MLKIKTKLKINTKIESTITQIDDNRFLVDSFTKQSKQYLVTIRRTNSGQKEMDMKCTCMSNTTFKKDEWCKHIKKVLKFLKK